MSAESPKNLRCEYLPNPLGVDVAAPRLSWEVTDERRGAKQTVWHVLVASSPEQLAAGEGDLWDSGTVEGAQTSQVAYEGRALVTLQTAWWQVRTWDAEGVASPWSEVATWEMGVLEPESWRGEWVGAIADDGKAERPCPYVRKEFLLDSVPARARLVVTAHGLYECEINGQRVGTDVLTPGWTSFDNRIPYQVYDVTELVDAGDNVIGGILGDGWFAGHLGFAKRRNNWGKEPALRAMLVLDHADGGRDIVATDGSWQVITGPVLTSDIYMGEVYDAQLEMPGWSRAGFDASQWSAVTIYPDTGAELCWKRAENVEVIEELPAKELTEPAPGVYVFDLGQNMVGWVRLTMAGPAGTEVTIRHGEMLQDNGHIYTENLRAAKATDVYMLKGEGVETYSPRFTFHGFRYVELTGCAEPPTLETVTGVVLHSGAKATGDFSCSHELVNQLQSNIRWGQKGNFLEAPTDCPQRDERLGWTGDAQVFIRTACWNMDVAAFFTKWLRDMRDDQREDGAVPDVVPHLLCGFGRCAWGDAMIVCPWTIYQCYGDEQILAEQYDAMCRWIAFMKDTSTDLIRPNDGYGDWLAIDAPSPGRAPTPRDLVGTAYLAHGAAIMSKVAVILGKAGDARYFTQLANDVKVAFNREYVTPGGRVLGHAQTGYLLALGFDLLPETSREAALDHLVTDIESRGWHLSTGFVGTPLLAPVLTKCGRMDVAYKLLLQETYPGWLYSILNGATTMWERWNSYTKEDGFGAVAMNSFNHYAYGAIGEWLYNAVAGIEIDPEEPGYAHILIQPQPGGGLTWAKANLHSIHGPITSAWTLDDDGGATFSFGLPANTTATVTLPAGCAEDIAENGKDLVSVDGISDVRLEGGKVIFTAGAGSYCLTAKQVTVV